jgi:DNA processing protein
MAMGASGETPLRWISGIIHRLADADVTNSRRNHVIAGLTDVSVQWMGQTRSGSRHEVEQAIIYGRPVLMWAPALAGQPWGQQLVASGAATLVSSAKEIVTTLHNKGWQH